MPVHDPCIQVDGLRVERDGVPILRGVSLHVRCGERLIVGGPNGAGKTTLLKAVLGLVTPSAGTVRVRGEAVGSRAWARGRRRVGYVHQESVQAELPISGREVVEIGTSALGLPRAHARARVQASLEAAGCAHLARRAYAGLSGGEKQRLSIARCLCQDPVLLLLDEPTSSLDPAARADVLALLCALNEERGLTVLVVSHDAELLAAPGWRRESMEAGAFVPGASRG